MLYLEILGGWFLVSCIAAPFIGRFIATHAEPVEQMSVPLAVANTSTPEAPRLRTAESY